MQGDRKEFLLETLQCAQFDEAGLGQLVAHDKRRDDGKAGIDAGQQAEHRHVIGFRGNSRTYFTFQQVANSK